MRARAPSFAALLLAALTLAAAGCGGDDESSNGTTAPGGSTASAGAEVYASAGCGSCHTLAAAGSNGTTGPNLDDLKPDKETVEEQVKNGGGGMPSFRGRLSEQEIEDVATYVSESAGS